MSCQIILSIIIPHKNTPKFLQRCIDSIPILDTIEIVIVDDNSTDVDTNNFPGVCRKHTKVFFSKKELTAGGARNLGLEKATGKWIMFADSDDFFHENFYELVKGYFETDFELIYFGMNSVNSVTLKPANRAAGIMELLDKAVAGNQDKKDEIRYKFLYPSCKLIKRSLIDEHIIRFDVVPASNDTMFGVKVGVYAKKIQFVNKVIYCLTYRENSLVNSCKYENLKSRLLVSFDLYDFLNKFGKQRYAQSIVSHWFTLHKISYLQLFLNLPVLIKRYKYKAFIQDVKSAISHRIK
jgi:glycosyltransferase involved in cell wall biosynthesis